VRGLLHSPYLRGMGGGRCDSAEAMALPGGRRSRVSRSVRLRTTVSTRHNFGQSESHVEFPDCGHSYSHLRPVPAAATVGFNAGRGFSPVRL